MYCWCLCTIFTLIVLYASSFNRWTTLKSESKAITNFWRLIYFKWKLSVDEPYRIWLVLVSFFSKIWNITEVRTNPRTFLKWALTVKSKWPICLSRCWRVDVRIVWVYTHFYETIAWALFYTLFKNNNVSAFVSNKQTKNVR